MDYDDRKSAAPPRPAPEPEPETTEAELATRRKQEAESFRMSSSDDEEEDTSERERLKVRLLNVRSVRFLWSPVCFDGQMLKIGGEEEDRSDGAQEG